MKQRCLVVLGMHRSGTSAAAGGMALLGVDLGRSLVPATADNPAGHWEHSGVVDIHDRLLEALGTRWHKPMPAGNWWSLPEVAPFRDELVALIESSFGDAPLWGIKDPRMCRLVPMWKEVLAAGNAEPHYLLVYRHPVAVAASLAQRDGFLPEEAYLLWLEHTLEAEAGTRDERRSVVEYDRLLREPSEEWQRVGEELGLSWPRPPREIAAELAAFVNPELRHQSVSDSGDEALPAWVRSAWEHRPTAGVPSAAADRAALTRIRRNLEATLTYLPIVKALEERAPASELAGHMQHARNLEAQVSQLREDVAAHKLLNETRESEMKALRADLEGIRVHASNLEGLTEHRDSEVKALRADLEGFRLHASNLEELTELRESEMQELRADREGFRLHASNLEQLTESQESAIKTLRAELEKFRVSDTKLERLTAHRESEIEALRAELEDSRIRASNLERAELKLRRSCEQLERTEEELRKDRDALDLQLARRLEVSEELRQDRDALDRRLAGNFAALKEIKRDNWREARRAEARERERDTFIESQARLLAEREQQIAYWLHVIADRENSLENSKEAVEHLHHVVADRESSLDYLRGEVARRIEEVAHRDARVGQLAGQLAAVRASRSWRITRPLRWISQKLGARPEAAAVGQPASPEPEDRSHQA